MDVRLVIALLLVSIMSSATMLFHAQAQLSPNFYDTTCPNALSTIRTSIRRAIAAERRMASSLIRLHFHDCFVQGCDASILLEDGPGISTEQTVGGNRNSARGYEVVETAKAAVERLCPGVVSCADVLAIAARDASEYVNGPSWTVKLGRRDSDTTSPAQVMTELPGFTDDLTTLIGKFRNKGLSERDMVALSGAHTIGQAQCFTFRDRIYSNGTDINVGFATMRRRRCPVDPSQGSGNLAAMDLVTPNSFDNNYFRNLMQRKGLLASDQVLFSGGSTDGLVREYSTNKGQTTFRSDFAAAMIRMGDIQPLTGASGIIRTVCRAIN